LKFQRTNEIQKYWIYLWFNSSNKLQREFSTFYTVNLKIFSSKHYCCWVCNQRKKANRTDQLEGIMKLIKYKLKSLLTLRKSILTFPNHVLSCLEFSSEHYFLEVKKIRFLSKHDWRNLSLSLFIRISFARKMLQNLFKGEMVFLHILIIFYLQIMISSCKDDF
jgi:hypothetical protein